MSARLDRFLTRLWLSFGGACIVGLSLYMGAVIGVRRWPYVVKETIVLTPEVPRGGYFQYARVINYQDECALHYDRRLQSLVPGPKGDLRRDVLPDIEFERPPFSLDNRLQSQAVPIADDFPCGPAVMIDSPAASCNWFQRIFWPQHRPDAVTQFRVTCPGGP